MLVKKKIRTFSKRKKIKNFLIMFRFLQNLAVKTNNIKPFIRYFYSPCTFLKPKLLVIQSASGVSTQVEFEYLNRLDYKKYNLRLKKLFFTNSYSNNKGAKDKLSLVCKEIQKSINNLFI